MKKYIACVILSVVMLSACDNKRDHNGDFGGYWQMVEWRDNYDEVVATKEDRIFYSVQLNLMKFQKITDNYYDYYLSYFNRTKDSLIVYRPVKFANDSLVSLSDLARYGVPSDGRFHVDVLNEEHMQLSSPETGVLVFRKY